VQIVVETAARERERDLAPFLELCQQIVLGTNIEKRCGKFLQRHPTKAAAAGVHMCVQYAVIRHNDEAEADA